MSSYWSRYPHLEKELAQVQTLIEEKLRLRNPVIQDALVTLSQSGGKYLRPAFFFLFADSTQQSIKNEQQLISIAASLEILHMATLIHDDIIDDSPLRRGQKTIQSRFGKDIAVYTGDFLFTVFFDLLLEAMPSSPYMTINAKTMRKLLIGELDQMHLYFNQQQTIQDYLRAVSGKTAALFRLACQEGAYFGGGNQETIRLARHIGFNIGMAFQILDDVLDYTADSQAFNKPVLEDITNGVYSLPLLFALNKEPQTFKPLLDKKENITEEEIHHVVTLIHQNKGIDDARKLAEQFTKKALADIHKLPNSKSKKILLTLTKKLLKRHV